MCRGRLRAHTTVDMKFKELFRVAKTFGVKRLEKLKLLRKKPQKRCAGAWNSLPSIAFEKILLFLVQQSVEDLHKCRMVCKSWNNRIKNEFCIINRREVVQQRMNFNWKEGLYPSRCEVLQAKKAVRYGLLDQTKVEDFVMRIKIAMYGGYGDHPQCELRPNFDDYKSAASLAEAGLIHNIDTIGIWPGYDVRMMPREAVDSLVQCVTDGVFINRLEGPSYIRRIYGNVKSKVLGIGYQVLPERETKILVEAMEQRIACLMIRADVDLDINALLEYSGMGLCKDIRLGYDAGCKYGDQLMQWSLRNKWVTTVNYQGDKERFEMKFYKMRFV